MTSETMTASGNWNSQVESEIRDYIERGRPHKNLNLEQLQGLFKRIFHNLAHLTSLKTMFIKMHDVQAEYALRRLDPPYELVKDDAEQFIEKVSSGAGLDAD
jgi:hypothetical protein